MHACRLTLEGNLLRKSGLDDLMVVRGDKEMEELFETGGVLVYTFRRWMVFLQSFRRFVPERERRLLH